MSDELVPKCDAGGCDRPATHVVWSHEAEPYACEKHGDRAYVNGVLQEGWKVDPACTHEYAPCPFCPPIWVGYVQGDDSVIG